VTPIVTPPLRPCVHEKNKTKRLSVGGRVLELRSFAASQLATCGQSITELLTSVHTDAHTRTGEYTQMCVVLDFFLDREHFGLLQFSGFLDFGIAQRRIECP